MSQSEKHGQDSDTHIPSLPETIEPGGSTHIDRDPNYFYGSSKKIVRIEYPGLVRNVSKAIETLGGLHSIEKAVADHRNKLELHFSTENRFSKPCVADRDLSPGILIKVKSNCSEESSSSTYPYEIVGVTSLNFKFNRMCDFQYLPVVPSNESNGKSDNYEYVYDKILPDSLPTIKWFLSKESTDQPTFCIPTSFARFDSLQNRLYLNAGERFESNVRPEIAKCIENYNVTRRPKQQDRDKTKQVSIFVNLQLPNVQVPDQPLSYTMELIRERNLEHLYKTVKQLFEERPVWTKVAIQYKTGVTAEQAKVLLPAVAYFCLIGPWRTTWIRFEYNPQKDFNSRIYQTLDYRIRDTEGTKIKVNAKRAHTSKYLSYIEGNSDRKFSLKDNAASSSNKNVIEERSFILRPNCIPPGRQMFYQYCDILIPEIQDMVSRLPQLPAGSKCDLKNGWLPISFTEQCREIVNKYVMDQVQEELLEDAIKLQQHRESEQPGEKIKSFAEKDPASYCSKMLSNIKKGIYKSVHVPGIGDPHSSSTSDAVPVDTIELTDDTPEDETEQLDAEEVVNSIPERMDENSDDDHLSRTSSLDIDMEALEEVNKMIGIQEDEEVNAVACYLKNKI